MLRRVFRQSSQAYRQQAVRHCQLNEYLNLREQLNPESAKQTLKVHQDLLKQYNLSSQELQQLIGLLCVDLNVYRRNYSYEAFNKENNNILTQYRQNIFYDASQGVNGSVRNLQRQFENVVKLLAQPSQARKEALKDLQQIFLAEQANLENLKEKNYGQKYLAQFQKRIYQHIKDLQAKHANKPELVSQIELTLNTLLLKFSEDPEIQNGRIVSYIQILNNYASGQLVVQNETNNVKLINQQPQKLDFGLSLTPEQLKEIENIDQRDLKLLAEEYTQEFVQGRKYYLMPWIDNKKVVFEAEYHNSRYLLLAALTGGLAFYLFSKIYYGDAQYKTLIFYSALTAGIGLMTRKNLNKFSMNYLTQMSLNRDGKTVDLVLQNGNGIQQLQGVSISSFKLYKTDVQVQLAGQSQKLSFFRENQQLANDAYYAEIDGLNFYVPFSHQGNNEVLKQIFNGQNVDTQKL